VPHTRFDDIAAIIVHHNSPDTLPAVLTGLRNAGLPAGAILIVDNSDNSVDAAAAVVAAGAVAPSSPASESGLEDRVTVLKTFNRGFAAAVNNGLDHLAESGHSRRFTLVLSHDAVAEIDALQVMRDAVVTDNEIVAAGPTLIHHGPGNARVWSTGGRLTRLLKLPRHHRELTDKNTVNRLDLVARDWLDGSFTLYRTDTLARFRFDETFFLYFDETDLHTRLRRAGYRVVWVPAAWVAHAPHSIPPLLLGRNLTLFHERHFSRGRGRLAAAWQALVAIPVTVLARQNPFTEVRQILAGHRSARGPRR
jgi:N-acetylglucosaminyl-diphospho-decaprenol L-rhamnosyltransferase